MTSSPQAGDDLDRLDSTVPATSEKKADQYRRRTANLLEKTATKVRELGHDAPGGDRTTRWGYQAGGSMDRAASYLHERSSDEISKEMQDWVRANPAPALAAAVAVGFLAGITLRRR